VKQIELMAGIIVAFLFVTPSSMQFSQFNAQSIPAASGIDLTIDFGNGTAVSYSGLSAANVYNLTIAIFDVDATWAGNRVYINAIDGVFRDDTHGWQYWVNGNYATIAANLYTLSDGDFVLWNRTVSGFQNQTELDLTAIGGGLLIAIGGLVFLALLYWRSRRR
jgi:hypothetical protein